MQYVAGATGINLVNLATPGATIDRTVVNGIGAPDFVAQTASFINTYGASNATNAKWSSSDSVFGESSCTWSFSNEGNGPGKW